LPSYCCLKDFGPYGIIFMNVCVTVAMVMLLRDFGPYGIIFMDCVYCVIDLHKIMILGDLTATF
jgi:uncharacterized YccA/Bax inhibitor family protein